jgi:hypothetical protein
MSLLIAEKRFAPSSEGNGQCWLAIFSFRAEWRFERGNSISVLV